MGHYQIFISEETEDLLHPLAETSGVRIEDLLQDVIDLKVKEAIASLVLLQFKEGKLRAREAWKLSGLSYQEFQQLASDVK